MNLRRPLLAAISIALLAVLARAEDWYVDAVHGSDSNPGTAPSQVWRTITCAVANVPMVGIQRVFVAAGRYDEALGEQFPIYMRSKLQLIGAGPATTEIVNNLPPTPAPSEIHAGVINCLSDWEAPNPNITPGTVLAGFRITSTRDPYALHYPPIGVWMNCYTGRCDLELRDLAIDSMAWGLRLDGFARIEMSRVNLRRNGVGLYLADYGNCTASELTVVDNYFGIYYVGHGGATTAVTISRSRIEGNRSRGIIAGAQSYGFLHPGRMQLKVSDSVIAHNTGTNYGEAAVSLGADEYGRGEARFERCSIVDNDRGVYIYGGIATGLDSCLLQNLGEDLDGWPMVRARFSNISDGDFVGLDGNISAPVLFVDAAHGDYRLQFDSPGIDAGNPATGAGTRDYLGTLRSIDGDLDTIERTDIGAFEFAPLFRRGSGRIGTTLELECWGPVGGIANIQFSRKPLVSAPLSTPFGQLDLDPMNIGPLGVSAVGQSAPVIFQHPIPNTPSLIGHTFSFQARTTSPIAPSGSAYTNGVQFTVLP